MQPSILIDNATVRNTVVRHIHADQLAWHFSSYAATGRVVL